MVPMATTEPEATWLRLRSGFATLFPRRARRGHRHQVAAAFALAGGIGGHGSAKEKTEDRSQRNHRTRVERNTTQGVNLGGRYEVVGWRTGPTLALEGGHEQLAKALRIGASFERAHGLANEEAEHLALARAELTNLVGVASH